MVKPAKFGDAPALIAHRESDFSKPERLFATLVGALRVSSGAKNIAFTYNVDNTINTIVLTFNVNGSDVDETLTCTYGANGLISNMAKT